MIIRYLCSTSKCWELGNVVVLRGDLNQTLRVKLYGKSFFVCFSDGLWFSCGLVVVLFGYRVYVVVNEERC